MVTERVLVTGFGPFGDVEVNPSGVVAEALVVEAPAAITVQCAVLPVTFAGAPMAIDEALAQLSTPPTLVLGLGVHPGRTFRIERCARAHVGHRERRDTAGAIDYAGDADATGALHTGIDVMRAALALGSAGGGAVTVSRDAGGYVCERAYHRLLRRAHERAIAAVFLHVPPAAVMPAVRQAEIVRAWLAQLAAWRLA